MFDFSDTQLTMEKVHHALKKSKACFQTTESQALVQGKNQGLILYKWSC